MKTIPLILDTHIGYGPELPTRTTRKEKRKEKKKGGGKGENEHDLEFL
jgi:hypothetical protein